MTPSGISFRGSARDGNTNDDVVATFMVAGYSVSLVAVVIRRLRDGLVPVSGDDAGIGCFALQCARQPARVPAGPEQLNASVLTQGILLHPFCLSRTQALRQEDFLRSTSTTSVAYFPSSSKEWSNA